MIPIKAQPSLSRRDVMKAGIAASAALSVGIPITQAEAQAAQATDAGIVWHKGVCRFCGTGCGLQVGTMNGQVVATKGDPDAPVNRGLNCIKGYFNAKILYGKDRLTQPLLRKKDGHYDKNGRFEPVSWDEAMDVLVEQFRKTYAAKGPSGVGIIGSGQYTIPEAYTASKLMKGGLRSNNIDPNARLCMASAVVGFYQTFGVDEPSNVYADMELTNTFVLWGNNMGEAHPVLWSRVTSRKLTGKDVKIVNLTTHGNSCSAMADLEIIFKPNTDLAIANYVLREIVKRKAYDEKFINDHCIFATGVTDIGYGMRPTSKFAYEAEKDTQEKQLKKTLSLAEAIGQGRKEGEVVEQKHAAANGAHWHITFEEFQKGLEPYTLDFVAQLAKGDPEESLDSFKKKLQQLADIYCDREHRDILSFWCMGVNQHVRGVWVNEQIYALHLLTNRQARPGNGAFSLTGQPSACGSAREVGAFSHRLPADMLVGNPAHEKKTEGLWHLPNGTLNPVLGKPLIGMLRGLEDGSVNFLWTMVVNVFQSGPNANHWLRAARKPENFVVVSDCYPTLSCKVADLILPTAMIFEKWGLFGNAERRTQAWAQMVKAPGQARTDIAIMMDFARRIKVKECWGEKQVGNKTLPNVLDKAKEMGIDPEASLFDVLFAGMPSTKECPWPDPKYPGTDNSTADTLGVKWFPEKALFTEYRQFTLGNGHDLATFDTYEDPKVHGLTWPVVNGKETHWRFNAKYDPYVKSGDYDFYGKLMKAIPTGNLQGVTDKKPVPLPGKAKIFFRPYADPVEMPDKNYDLNLCTGRILEHWHTGTMTRRVPELHRAEPTAVLYMNPKDAAERNLKREDVAQITSRRGSIKAVVETQGRMKMPRGSVWLAFFDETVQVNKLCIDATDPISGEPDYKKAAVRVVRA